MADPLKWEERRKKIAECAKRIEESAREIGFLKAQMERHEINIMQEREKLDCLLINYSKPGEDND